VAGWGGGRGKGVEVRAGIAQDAMQGVPGNSTKQEKNGKIKKRPPQNPTPVPSSSLETDTSLLEKMRPTDEGNKKRVQQHDVVTYERQNNPEEENTRSE